MILFYTEQKWKNIWLKKVKEYALRYASNPNLFAVELWNEINSTYRIKERDPFFEWSAEMAPKVQELFPNTMVINSLGSLCNDHNASDYQNFPFNAYAFDQVHCYLDMGAQWDFCKNDVVSLAKEALNYMKSEHRPILLAETGAVEPNHSGPFKYYGNDHRGILFTDCVYTPLFVGAAGSGNIWHWNNYVETKNIFDLFQPLAELTQGIAFDEQGFVPKCCSTDETHILLLEGREHILGFVRNKQDNWKRVLRDRLSPSPVDVTIPSLGNGKPTVYPLWESFPVSEKEGSVLFHHMRYGALLRVDK